MEKENFVTIDALLETFQNLSAQGYGDMKIKCIDGYLHDDEIAYDYMGRQINIRGNIFNFDVTDKIMKFCYAVEAARKDFTT